MSPILIVMLGALVMLAALINARRLIAIVNKTEYGAKWKGLFAFMLAFLASYIAFGFILYKDVRLIDPNLLVSMVFLFGGIFVFLVVALNYSTFNGLLVLKQKELFAQLTETARSIADLSKQLAQGSDSISLTASQISESISEIAGDSEQQSKSTGEVHSLVDQIATAIDQVSKGAIEQSRNVSDTTGSMGQLASAIDKVAENAKTVLNVVSDSQQIASRGQEAVGESMSGMARIRATVSESANKIQTLGEKSKQIGEIIEVIDDIAEQTNLLALNAAIEAARAGEHGKGFAVVADEVRKLAERSARATGEIAELIKGIQDETMQAVEAMQRGTSEVEAGSELAHHAGTAIEEMMGAINRVFSEIAEVSQAAEQISASSNKVVVAMDQIATITEENTAITEEVAASAEQVVNIVESIAEFSKNSASQAMQISASSQEQSGSVQEIAASVAELSNMADRLYKLVERFQLS
ncbi:MAG: methyl-accepting chemotaxis protein [Firmicutes bacterium]|nr:methyl-accepting chemotaxis protein [Bacillota bacterium]